jgi:hypothetical protein
MMIIPMFLLGILLITADTVVYAQPLKIKVGLNVHVSSAHANSPLGEIWLSADAKDPNHLLGCGIVYSPEENRRWTAIYLSTDRGKTWKMTLETKKWADSADPACAIGPGGAAHHITIATRYPEPYVLAAYRSADGGATWEELHGLAMKHQGVDRESIVADQTGGKYNGRVYIVGESSVRTTDGSKPPTNGMGMWVSEDGGKTFQTHLKMVSPDNRYTLGVGNSVVMSDGTVATVFGELKNSTGKTTEKNRPDYAIAILNYFTSADGGESIDKATKIDDFWMSWPPATVHVTPSIDADPGSAAFKDRLYVTFSDERSGRSEIYFSISSDKGKTWSHPVVISDDQAWAKGKGPNNFLPSVAANKDGVVGVMWYDRRDHPDNMGWDVRFRASMDGGETWLSSVKVSEQPNLWTDSTFLFTSANALGGGTGGYTRRDPSAPGPITINVSMQGRQFNAGDYANLVADAGGMFHAFWIDNRTGKSQIWTAPITVNGAAAKYGGGELTKLEDVTSKVTFTFTNSSFNRSTNTVVVSAQLENRSKDTLVEPIKARIVALSSKLAHSILLTSANVGDGGPGSVIDLSDVLEGAVLRPGEKSRPKQLMFKLSDLLPLHAESEVRTNLVTMQVTVLGKVKSADKPATP